MESVFDWLEGNGQAPDPRGLPNADVEVHPALFVKEEADDLFDQLRSEIPWTQEKIRLYGKTHDLPRLTAWHGDPHRSYLYSGIRVDARPWTPSLLTIKKKIENLSGVTFNSVLLNLYRSGTDGVAWHSDDEPELGVNPIIGSLSLGQARIFQLRHRQAPRQTHNILLAHGDYLLMKGPMQHHWQHQIPKSKKNLGERINLTFRQVH